MARTPRAAPDTEHVDPAADNRRIRRPKGANTEMCMIRVNLPPDLHRKLWELRLERRSSIQKIVTDILAEKLGSK